MDLDNCGSEEAGWEWINALEAERVRQLRAAFEECREKGVSQQALLTLAFETGAVWESDHRDARTARVGS